MNNNPCLFIAFNFFSHSSFTIDYVYDQGQGSPWISASLTAFGTSLGTQWAHHRNCTLPTNAASPWVNQPTNQFSLLEERQKYPTKRDPRRLNKDYMTLSTSAPAKGHPSKMKTNILICSQPCLKQFLKVIIVLLDSQYADAYPSLLYHLEKMAGRQMAK